MSVDEGNVAFWNELCGTTMARRLGINDDSPSSLKKFDDWYFDFYPYLKDHIPFEELSGNKVLEIGLGYGTVAQRLMQSGTDYRGLDIASGPVMMARRRAQLLGKTFDISQGSALAIPYPDEALDFVVTIGCLHHTGNLALALQEVHRVLKPGGGSTIMVYNALSYRHWLRAPIATRYRSNNVSFEWSNAGSGIRRTYDVDQKGRAAPSTAFVTPKEAELFLSNLYRSVRVTPRNISSSRWTELLISRSQARAWFESFVGLDLYIECIK